MTSVAAVITLDHLVRNGELLVEHATVIFLHNLLRTAITNFRCGTARSLRSSEQPNPRI